MTGHSIMWISLIAITLSGGSQTQKVHVICSYMIRKPNLWSMGTEVRKMLISL